MSQPLRLRAEIYGEVARLLGKVQMKQCHEKRKHRMWERWEGVSLQGVQGVG